MSSRGHVYRKKRISRSARAGIVFPVTRISRYLKKSCLNRRIGVAAPVYLGAVLEYLVAEVLELAGNAARDNKKRIVSPRHILLSIANDTELCQLLRGVIISQGGVLPHINEVLLYRKKQLADAFKSKATPSTAPPASPRAGRKKTTVVKRQRIKKTTVTKGYTILSEKILLGGQKLTVVQGSIAAIKCDAVIHPTNSSLSLSGQCGSALCTAGGPSFRTQVNSASTGNLLVGEAVMSESGSLPCDHVIHVHSPSWNNTDALSNLEKSVQSCLNLAEEKKLVSVGFPSIASGSNNFPKQTSAQTILRCIKDYYSARAGSIKQVYFVLYDMESIGIYTSELARLDM